MTTFALGLRTRRLLNAWVVGLLAGAAAYAMANSASRRLPHAQPLEELSYYPSGRSLKPAVLGQDEAVADLAWLRAVQYYGEHRNTDNRFTRMPHVFDILTTLSPRFLPAYVFGAFALAQEGRDFASAERLMQKGIEANPGSGRLAFEMGFLYYVRPGGRDLRRAAECFEQAAHQPDAPAASARFAAFAREQTGDLRVAHELWAAVARESPNRYMRDMAERNLREIEDALERGRQSSPVAPLPTPYVVVRPHP